MSDAARPSAASKATDHSADLQIGIAMATVGLYVSAMGAVLAGLATEFSVNPASLSWVGSTFGVGLIVVAVFGRLILRRGARPAITASTLAFACGTLLVALAPSLALIFVGAVIQGLAAAVTILVAPVMLAEAAAIRLTRVNAAASLIGIAAPLLVGAAIGIGLPGRLALLTLVPLLAWLLWILLRLPRTAHPGSASSGPIEEAGIRPSRWATIRRWLAVTMAVSVEFCYVVWGVSRLRTAGLDTSLAAILGISFPVGMAAGRLLGPALIRRLPAVPYGVAVSILGTLLVVLSSSWPVVAAGLAIAGLGVATLYPVSLARLLDVPGLSSNHAASLGALASGAAIVLAPVALATLATVMDLRLAFGVPIPLLLILLALHGRHPRAATA